MLEQCAVGPERDSALATPIITDGSLDRVANAPRVVLPDPAAVFADRAARFLQLASGRPMSDYLPLMGALDVSCNE
jgi:formate dehydrogenase maturation protein FdhE